MGCTGIALGKTNPPDSVAEAGFDQHALGGAVQKGGKRFVLGKLCLVAAHNNLEAAGLPNLLVKALHPAPKLFRGCGLSGCHNLFAGARIAKETRFFSHHKMFSRQVGNVLHLKRGGPPLAQTALADLAVGAGAVAPEEKVFHPCVRGKGSF